MQLKALIVEDSEEDTLLVTRELMRSGYDLVHKRVDTPESFVASLENPTWDVILCDYSMPNFSAPAALNLLRAKGLDIPFIIVSGCIGEDTAVAMMKAGAHDYIMKDRLSRLAPAISREVADADARRARRKAEEERRESEANLKHAQAVAHVGSWHLDLTRDELLWSEETYRIFGLNPSMPMTYEKFIEAVHPDDRQHVNNAWSAAIGGQPYNIEHRIVVDGETRWVRENAEIRSDEEGNALSGVGTVQDVTQRRLYEERIENLNRVYAMLSSVNQLILRAPDRKTLFDEACRIAVDKGGFVMAWIGVVDEDTWQVRPLSYSGCEKGYLESVRISLADEPEGRGPTGIAISEGRHFICNNIEKDPLMLPWRDKAMEKGYLASAAFPLYGDSGSFGAYMVYSGSAGFFDDEEVALLDELAADLSFALSSMEQKERRRRAEECLRESEERLRAVLDATMDGILVADAEGWGFVMSNRAMCGMLGYSTEELLKLGIEEIHPDEALPHVRREFEQQLRGELTVATDLPVKRRDGTVFYADVSAAPMELDGRTYLVSSFHDVTERKEAEAELKRESSVTRAMLETSTTISAKLDWDDIAQDIADLMRGITAGKSVLVFQLDGDGVLSPLKAAGLNGEALKHFYAIQAPIEGILGFSHALELKTALCITESELNEFGLGEYAGPLELGVFVITPITSRDKTVGFICVNFEKVQPGSRTVSIIEGIARQLGVGYEVCRLYTESQRKTIELARSIEMLKVLSEIDRGILSTLDRDEMMNQAVTQMRRVAPADVAAVFLVDDDAACMRFSYGWCLDLKIGECVPLEMYPGYKALVSGEVLVHKNLMELTQPIGMDRTMLESGIMSEVFAPIIRKGKSVGVFHVGCYRVAGFTPDEVKTVEKLSSQLGIALENAKLLSDLEGMLIGIVTTLASAIDAKSPWTKGHSERVTNYALKIAEKMGLSEKDRERLRLAGLLHDIGKLGTYDIILNKTGKLSSEEFEQVKKHPAMGADILSPIKQFRDILPAIRHHHERWDGKGYPDGLAGEGIPLSARILSVADSFDSMTANRPYRPSLGKEYAVKELDRCKNSQFDSKVVDVFLEIVDGLGGYELAA